MSVNELYLVEYSDQKQIISDNVEEIVKYHIRQMNQEGLVFKKIFVDNQLIEIYQLHQKEILDKHYYYYQHQLRTCGYIKYFKPHKIFEHNKNNVTLFLFASNYKQVIQDKYINLLA